jgi:hypothetical protein
MRGTGLELLGVQTPFFGAMRRIKCSPRQYLMTTSQEAATAPKSKTPSHISLFGQPPLIKRENAAAYDELHGRCPTDFVEEIWIRDIVDGKRKGEGPRRNQTQT